MPAPVVVLIGAPDVLDALRTRTGAAENAALVFPDSEPLRALQAITEHRPGLVVLERGFAATPRGAALISRLKADPALSASEVRVLAHNSEYTRVVVRAAVAVTVPPGSAAEPAPQERPPSLDWRGTRRAPRVRIRQGVEVQIDGNPAALVDMSVVGAQILCPVPLRPEQKVRVTVPNESHPIRLRAAVAWARFELPRTAGGSPHYRAGIEFVDAPKEPLEEFCHRHKV